MVRSQQHINQRRRPAQVETPSSFQVMFTGQIKSASFTFNNIDTLYCRYSFNFGIDWEIIHGVESGTTQIARLRDLLYGNNEQSFYFGFPIDISFKSTSAHGWPRIIIQLYSTDFLGRDVILGYGCCLCPISPGHHIKEVYTYWPVSSSPWRRFLHWITGTPPEFYDENFIALGQSRNIVRVQCDGVVRIAFNTTTKDMGTFGYTS